MTLTKEKIRKMKALLVKRVTESGVDDLHRWKNSRALRSKERGALARAGIVRLRILSIRDSGAEGRNLNALGNAAPFRI